jgi:uncharacterized protein involved in exopolysaccharide biosynthesis
MSRKINMRKRSESAPEEVSESTRKSEIDLFEIARLALRRRHLIASVCTLVVLATAGYLFSHPNQYTSTAVILPSGGGSSYSSLKAFVGMATGMGGSSDENSSAMFPTILKSELVADAVLSKEYQFEVDGQFENTSLSDYFGTEDPDRLKLALNAATSVSTDARTGEISVSVETSYPGLSRAVLTEYLDQLEAFNLYKRRSRAKENQTYLENQLAGASGLLAAAEDELERYREANANWATTGSAKILTRTSRLEREIAIRSQAYLLLQQQYEMAKFEAQKDVPIVRILDQPSLPTQKSGPFRRNIIVLSGIVSFGLVILVLFMFDLARQAVGGRNRSGLNRLRNDLTEAFPRSAQRLSRRQTGRAAYETDLADSDWERVPAGSVAENDS